MEDSFLLFGQQALQLNINHVPTDGGLGHEKRLPTLWVGSVAIEFDQVISA
jgi:hypothetical protein